MSDSVQVKDENVESELEKKDRELFNTIADTYCKKDMSASSRPPRKQRLIKTLSLLPDSSSFNVLEVGCGCGYTAEYLQGLYSHYTGVDYAEKLIDYAREFNGYDNTDFVAANINDYEPEEKADVILMIGVLHHFDDYEATFRRILELLKPGGWVLINEPQSANLIIQIARKIRAVVDKSYSEDQLSFSSDMLKELFEKSGLENCRIVPQGLFSTPFAEVVFKPDFLFGKVAGTAVLADKISESVFGGLLKYVSWNLIAAGQKKIDES